LLDRGTVPDLLAQRAWIGSDKRVVFAGAFVLVAADLVAVMRPPLWIPLAALAFCLGAFGVWGILDRETADASHGSKNSRVLMGARAITAALGGTAAAIFGVSLFFALLGQWIS
jgi:hypothetical protein